MRESGIYKIQSKKKPERFYIGSAVDINHRWSEHLSSLKHQKHRSPKLQRHVNKYGFDDLEFSIITTCLKEELIKNEQFFIDALNPYFNTCPTAGNMLGFHFSEESKAKMSKAQKGRPSTFKGKKHTEETRHILSEIAKKRPPITLGRKASEESRKRMSDAQKKYREEHPDYCNYPTFLGYTHSETTRQKLSELKKGKPGRRLSQEEKDHLSKINKGRRHTPATIQKMKDAANSMTAEHRLKISSAKKGRKLSPEHIAKLSISRKGNQYAKGIVRSEETRRKLSLALKGKKAWNKGIPRTEEEKRLISERTKVAMQVWMEKRKAS